MTRWTALLVLASCSGARTSWDLSLEDANNYRWSGGLDIGDATVAAQTDITVDWSALTTDMWGRSFTGWVDEALLMQVSRPREDFDAEWCGWLRDVESFWNIDPAPQGRALASEFDILGNAFDPMALEEDPASTWVFVLADDAVDGWDFRWMELVTPRLDATATRIDVVDGQTSAASGRDLHSARPIEALAGALPYRLDWSGVTTDAQGEPLDRHSMAELVIARLQAATPEEAEPLLARLDQEAAELYRLEVTSTVTAAFLDQAGHACTIQLADEVNALLAAPLES